MTIFDMLKTNPELMKLAVFGVVWLVVLLFFFNSFHKGVFGRGLFSMKGYDHTFFYMGDEKPDETEPEPKSASEPKPESVLESKHES